MLFACPRGIMGTLDVGAQSVGLVNCSFFRYIVIDGT